MAMRPQRSVAKIVILAVEEIHVCACVRACVRERVRACVLCVLVFVFVRVRRLLSSVHVLLLCRTNTR